ncbi:MAG TPA: hypothetical protein VGE63_03665 [Candidatus Paceibacterota bacterium]
MELLKNRARRFAVVMLNLSGVMSMGLLPVSVSAQVLQATMVGGEVVESALGTKSSETEEPKVDPRVEKIRAFFEARSLPAAEYAEEFVHYADMYDLDWRLVPSIAMLESTGFKHSCKRVTYSGLGWGSCKINFDSFEHGIDVVTKNLAGKNPRTESYYANKSVTEILNTYNPPSIRPDYVTIVTRTMRNIENQPV